MNVQPFHNPEDALRFIRGGRAVFTVQSRKTGKHLTYKVSHPEPDAPFFVNLLTGPDNGADYTYVGVLNDRAPGVKLTNKSKFTADSPPVAALNYVMRHLEVGHHMPPDCEIRHEGRCAICARPLTRPDSLELGIGPECASRLGLA